jgi:hypothetical protein
LALGAAGGSTARPSRGAAPALEAAGATPLDVVPLAWALGVARPADAFAEAVVSARGTLVGVGCTSTGRPVGCARVDTLGEGAGASVDAGGSGLVAEVCVGPSYKSAAAKNAPPTPTDTIAARRRHDPTGDEGPAG